VQRIDLPAEDLFGVSVQRLEPPIVLGRDVSADSVEDALLPSVNLRRPAGQREAVD